MNGVKLRPRSSHRAIRLIREVQRDRQHQTSVGRNGPILEQDPFLVAPSCGKTIIRIVVALGRTNGEVAPMSRLRIGDYCPYVSEMTLVPQINPAQARRLIGTPKLQNHLPEGRLDKSDSKTDNWRMATIATIGGPPKIGRTSRQNIEPRTGHR